MVIQIIKIFTVITFLFFFNNCTGFKPLYKENLSSVYKLQNFTIITNKKKISEKIKQNLIELFPNATEIKYIIKIEGLSDTIATVTDNTRKVSRY